MEAAPPPSDDSGTSAGWSRQLAGQSLSAPQPRSGPSAPSYQAVLNQYCVTCHNQRTKTAGLLLDTLDPAQVPDAAEAWEKVVRKLQTGTMPPQGV